MASTSSSKKNSAFPNLGVKLSVFRELMDEYQGKLTGLTTTEVCSQIIMPKTSEGQLSYVEYLKKHQNGVVQVANVFISHAWKFVFLEVVNAILYHFRNEEETVVVWFDLFSNNQHKATDNDFFWWSNTFMSAIKGFKRTVMVLAPFHDPIPLTRAWCLWELFCTIKTNSVFEVAMSAEERAEFLREISKNIRVGLDMMAKINLERSEAFKVTDKEMIFRAVQEDKGFDEINAMVLKVIRGWIIEETRSAVDRESDNILRYKLQNALAGLLKNQGDLKQAEAIYEKTLAERTNNPSLGPKHPDTLISMEKLAVLLRVKEKYEDAEKVFADCLSIRRELQAANGMQEADCFTLNTMHNLAIVFSKQKAKLEDAKALFSECLHLREKLLGVDDPYTLQSLDELGLVCHSLGMLPEAEEYLSRCLKNREQSKQMGTQHPDTLKSMDNLATIYVQQRRLDDAKALYLRCIEGRETRLGINNVETINAKSNLASLYQQQRHFLEAEKLFRDCLERKKKAFGVNSIETAKSMQLLAVSLQESVTVSGKGSLAFEKGHEAEILFEKCVAINSTTRGPDDRGTLDSIYTLAYFFYKREDYSKAEMNFRRCLEGRLKLMPEDHIDVKATRDYITKCQDAQEIEAAVATRKKEGKAVQLKKPTSENISPSSSSSHSCLPFSIQEMFGYSKNHHHQHKTNHSNSSSQGGLLAASRGHGTHKPSTLAVTTEGGTGASGHGKPTIGSPTNLKGKKSRKQSQHDRRFSALGVSKRFIFSISEG